VIRAPTSTTGASAVWARFEATVQIAQVITETITAPVSATACGLHRSNCAVRLLRRLVVV
jgi:hypothetical protein